MHTGAVSDQEKKKMYSESHGVGREVGPTTCEQSVPFAVCVLSMDPFLTKELKGHSRPGCRVCDLSPPIPD